MGVIGRQFAQAKVSAASIAQGTGATRIAAGTTAQRPVAPVAAMLRKNTTTGKVEHYDSVSSKWVGA